MCGKIMSELDRLKKREENQFTKMMDREYYFSEESKIEAHKINQLKEEYLQENPKSYELIAANLFSYNWSGIPDNSEREIFKLVGEGKYNENQGHYSKAIELYQKADDLTLKLCKDDLQEIIAENGPGDYLYTRVIRQRIRICEGYILRNKCKVIEDEARGLEESDPLRAIKMYEELNVLRPGMKKYDKRIEIINRKLKKE